ncbi:bifunctional hydroxymethylpyrimidine kinase/phosphomethylpyrimidine kinase [Oceanobacillus sp. FSL W7-1293]|uniref:bifunctional hydroxymethylpyrimidine kinase/phosphomethylpyrimidine kinase n=1 Tax=Oceanobacillus sp. FSL W7-1293 TaxID=2921699 RepID=UPI0030D2E8A5
MKKALTIAGSVCTGSAGIQAGMKTFSAHGVFGMSVITSVIAENKARVISYQVITPNIPEAEKIAKLEIKSLNNLKNTAKQIYQLTGVLTLIKGGHRMDNATGILYDGNLYHEFSRKE